MAVGSQTHANLSWPGPESEHSFLTEVAGLGLPIHITEPDVTGSRFGRLNQNADVNENNQPPVEARRDALVTSADEKPTGQSSNLFKVFFNHRHEIKLVTFWGVTDADSWRRNGKPLWFDENWRPEPPFDAIIQDVEKQKSFRASIK